MAWFDEQGIEFRGRRSDNTGINGGHGRVTVTDPAPQGAAVPHHGSLTPPGGEITRSTVLNTLKRYGAPTAENLQRAVAANPWLGSVVGSHGDKLRLSNGETWDVIHDVGGSNASWQTLTGHTAAAKAAQGGGAGSVALGAMGTQRLPTPAPFVPPSAADVMNDPGVQFRQEQAQKALERSAAAKGTLLTGGTANDLQAQAQGLASQEYGNAFNRALQAYGTNTQTPLSYFGANVNADLGYGNLALGNKQADNSYSLGLGNLNLATQGQNFNQGFSLAQLGYNAARDAGSFGGAYGQSAADIYGQQGNANAAGRVASGNAYNQAFSNIGNSALQAYYAHQYGVNPYGYPGN